MDSLPPPTGEKLASHTEKSHDDGVGMTAAKLLIIGVFASGAAGAAVLAERGLDSFQNAGQAEVKYDTAIASGDTTSAVFYDDRAESDRLKGYVLVVGSGAVLVLEAWIAGAVAGSNAQARRNDGERTPKPPTPTSTS